MNARVVAPFLPRALRLLDACADVDGDYLEWGLYTGTPHQTRAELNEVRYAGYSRQRSPRDASAFAVRLEPDGSHSVTTRNPIVFPPGWWLTLEPERIIALCLRTRRGTLIQRIGYHPGSNLRFGLRIAAGMRIL
jgi:hypothetical protein